MPDKRFNTLRTVKSNLLKSNRYTTLLEIASEYRSGEPEAGQVQGLGSLEWCGRVDSNHHGIATASPSSWCVCQFRHDRTAGKQSKVSKSSGQSSRVKSRYFEGAGGAGAGACGAGAAGCCGAGTAGAGAPGFAGAAGVGAGLENCSRTERPPPPAVLT
jgi:hypothetical protein